MFIWVKKSEGLSAGFRSVQVDSRVQNPEPLSVMVWSLCLTTGSARNAHYLKYTTFRVESSWLQ